MSRIGRKTIQIPSQVELEIDQKSSQVKVKGPKGSLNFFFHAKVKVEKIDQEIKVTRKSNDKLARSLHGLTRQIIANMIKGVTKGYQKKLEIIGTGYRAQLIDNKLILNVGYSHSVEIEAVQGINLKVEKNIITVQGIDKQLVGETAARIRRVRKPEPYKGKGIKYVDELLRRKVGKIAKAAEGAAGG